MKQERDRRLGDNALINNKNDNVSKASTLSVAPMMDWTDRHCRFFHRQLSQATVLYTEMVTAPALVRGQAVHLLAHDAAEHPVVLQLGGSDPAELAQATRLGWQAGYREINLNCGCPSDRVQSGCFGAILMKSPSLVADICKAMQDASPARITVKCRIGVDEADPREMLPAFLETLLGAGVAHVIIHARSAWLKGLSPKENREIPPLDHALVFEMKARFPQLQISLNGGVDSLAQAHALLAQGIDGVMVGRAAYQRPGDLLLGADHLIYGQDALPTEQALDRALAAMRAYIARELAQGTRLAAITRHMLGLFAGQPGARQWRRILSERAHVPEAGLEVLEQARAAVSAARDSAAVEPTGTAAPDR
ncbi:MAG: tRNA dihydrouridine(20/20a) synthase DusA [Roseinatronobacter sp.]